MIFVARLISVFIYPLGTSLNWREIALLSWMALRGIVVAAVSALFGLKLEAMIYA
jgi:NhaP-type Na+/H+ or K+/H+ antiporter